MQQEIPQWLEEIKTLKQRVSDLEKELDAALASTDRWRQMYNTEAQQRRVESQAAQQEIAALREQLNQRQDPVYSGQNIQGVAIRAEVASLKSVETLQLKLSAALEELDSLKAALKLEQENHAQTRRSLTAVIGDTVDQLARERRQQLSSLNPVAEPHP
jgi:chromosome segregation ATPase